MKRPLLTISLLALLLASPSMFESHAIADDPSTTAPSDPRGDRRFRVPFGRDNEADNKEAEAFMQEHSPNRFEMYQTLPDDSPQKRMVRRFITGRYRQMMDERRTDPDTYDLSVKQLSLDDEIFAIVHEYRRLPDDSPDRTKLKDELKAAMGEWVDNSLALRERWITRVEAALEREKKRLDTDKERRTAYIDERLTKVLSDDDDSASFKPDMGIPPMSPPHTEQPR